jgi:signal transduction histidine kinase
MKLKSRILISFSGLVCILIFTGVINVFFLMAINKYIDELVEKRFGIEQRVQSAHLIINQIYSKIFDTLLIDIDQRKKEIEDLDRLATAFFHHMDVLSDMRSYPSGGFTNQKRDFQTFYLVGKDLLAISTLTGLQENDEKMDRFKFYKKRLVSEIDHRFETYKNEFATSLSSLQRFAYIIVAVSTVLVILGALSASVISVKLSASLVRPIPRLTEAIRGFKPGMPHDPVDESAADEIGRLGKVFNEMTRQLNKSLDKLEAQTMETILAERKAARRRRQLFQADKMASLGFLVSGVAHEINNPNQFIMSHIDPLKNAWDGAIPVLDQYYSQYGDFRIGGVNYSQIKEKIPQIFSNITKGSQRIKSIVDELKGFANDSPCNSFTTVNLNQVVDSALSLTASMVKKSTHTFSFERAEDLPAVLGHFQRLEQVVVNLVQNACQALDSPQEKISIRTIYLREPNEVLLEIKDSGCGIQEQDLRHITDPFFTTKRDKGGTGLGLSISSKIIENHGGTILFKSTEMKGTTVTVHLPRYHTEEKSLE